jgi:hypothetical protein
MLVSAAEEFAWRFPPQQVEVVVQNSGTLTEMPLESILESVQQDRATGTLHLNSPGGTATLYFLFGHLFHAADGDRVGVPVVNQTLEWTEGDFTFDSKAKLPAEESIKVSTADLLAGKGGNVSQPSPQPTGEPVPAPDAPSDPASQPVADTSTQAVAEPAAEPAAAEDLHAAIEPAPIDLTPYQPEDTPGTAGTTSDVAAVPEVAGVEADAGAGPEPASPGSRSNKRRRTDFRPGTRPPETMELYPVPLGEALYESLTAAFVDFPKLLRSLNKDKLCGYVRLTGDDFNAVLLFTSGAVVEAIYEGKGEVSTGARAFKRFAENIENSEGHLDVIELSPEMVTAIFQLLTSPGLYDRLVARFVKFDALLEHLTAEGTSGAVIVRQGGKTGVVLFREGAILGSYTDDSRTVESDTVKVVAICKDPETKIEVRGGPLPESLPVLESGGSTSKTVPSGGSRSSATRTAAAPDAVETAEPETESETKPETAAEYDDSPNGVDALGVDWGAILSQMAGRADAALGTRSKKVKELLNASGHSREEVESTIERISELSIMFVDPSKLAGLADEMRRIAADAV